MKQYQVRTVLYLPEQANTRFSDLNRKEAERGYRTIGGDKGDLRFNGFHIEGESTQLDDAILVTDLNYLTDDEVDDIANEILHASYESIGIETVEHS